jgi:hypothetical protein
MHWQQSIFMQLRKLFVMATTMDLGEWLNENALVDIP